MLLKKAGFTSLILISFILAGCASAANAGPTPTPIPLVAQYEKTIFTVERGPIVSERKIIGEVTPRKQDELFFRTAGYVVRVSVKSGDVAKKGDILAELDNNDLNNQLQQANIDLEVAQADLAKNKAQHQFDLDKANADVVIKEKQVELAKINVQESLGTDRDKAQLNLDIAQQDLFLAQQALKLSSEDVNSYLEQAVKRSELAVTRLEGLLSERQIVAPYDCTILKSSVRAGSQADAYNTAFTVGDPSNLVIRSAYDTEMTQLLNTDSDVKLFLTVDAKDSFKSQYLANYKPERGLQTTNEQSSTAADYIYFSIPQNLGSQKVISGQTVFLTAVLGHKDDALLIPPAAIRDYKGLKFVIVQEGDKRRRVEINEIGLKSNDKWEIVADLQAGDQIIGP
jgi:multidrug efflux pump subunit AcrA (membrane-fusion protein)